MDCGIIKEIVTQLELAYIAGPKFVRLATLLLTAVSSAHEGYRPRKTFSLLTKVIQLYLFLKRCSERKLVNGSVISLYHILDLG